MKISYSSNFVKKSKKLQPKVRQQVIARVSLFAENPLHPMLRNHQLSGRYKKYRSIDITGDIRALYIQESNEAIFITLGSHSQLYG